MIPKMWRGVMLFAGGCSCLRGAGSNSGRHQCASPDQVRRYETPVTVASLGAAASGTNSDINSLTGLTTALSIAQGGIGSTTQNFVDIGSTQADIAGSKTFTAPLAITTSGNPGLLVSGGATGISATGSSSGGLWLTRQAKFSAREGFDGLTQPRDLRVRRRAADLREQVIACRRHHRARPAIETRHSARSGERGRLLSAVGKDHFAAAARREHDIAVHLQHHRR